ncbi:MULTISPECIES: sulfatase-like hydrolase/transferase [Citrobacter]|uniref:sulfatase-like hydrolase/transferase n=3 Tax=Enterobacteriaceae TaxID=543 RepID=UPI000812D3B8|nr:MULTISPECIES: sulfatase-like hydrolase/transferase [Citrobacter]OCO58605.1 hypothetical protein AN688_0223700 [Citrobacter freundii]KAA1148864.1 sulfatase-like hydrolase/transferase [Citrobacter portucalensis]MDE9710705.1 sulfatase-like hydrolase/transferase [Citrobacter portucalensis]MDM2816553.1 sulfatase-like hydrolase/transferase [Citrobacter sp. Cpo102]MDM2852392.1 sulfatase-like hydrolase/transferase [Citrobacter sp. Cpo065]
MFIFSLMCAISSILFSIFLTRDVKATIFSFIASTLLLFWFICNAISGDGFGFSAIYFFKTSMSGVSLGQFSSYFSYIVVYLATWGVAFYIQRKIKRNINSATTYILCFLCIVSNPLMSDLKNTYKILHTKSENNYQHANKEINNKKNVVLLYIESFERAYSNDSAFPGMTPNINKLREHSVDFSNIKTITGGNWTVAGMVSSQCGTPLIVNYSFNDNGLKSDHGKDFAGLNFIPGAYCLGDLLKDNGYQVVYMGGADSKFGGKSDFLLSHGYADIYDYSYFNDKFTSNDMSGWGVKDDILLDEFFKKYISLSESGKHFMLSGLTLDTHGPDGSLSNSCSNLDFPLMALKHPYLKSVYCDDHLISKLAKKIMESKYYKDTILVIMSDHTAFISNDISSYLEKVSRENNVMFFSPDLNPEQIDTLGSTVDIGATLLHLLGGDDTLGYGVSLFNNSENRLVNFSKDEMSSVLSSVQDLWFEKDNDVIYFDKDYYSIYGNRISINSNKKTLLSKEGNVKYIGDFSADFSSSTTEGDNIIYISKCNYFRDYQNDNNNMLCLWVGDNSNVGHIYKFKSGESIKLKDLQISHGVKSNLDEDIVVNLLPLNSMQMKGATLKAGMIKIKKSEPTVIYGPYINLPKGEYCISANGSISSNFHLEVTSNNGTNRFISNDIKNAGDGVIFHDQCFNSNTPINNFEVVFNITPGVDGFISNISIKETTPVNDDEHQSSGNEKKANKNIF